MPNVSLTAQQMRAKINELKRERDRILKRRAARDKQPEAKQEAKVQPKTEVITWGRFETADLDREPQVITVERVSDRLSRTTPRWSVYAKGWWYNYLLNAPDIDRYKLLPRVGQRVRIWWGKDPTAATARKVLRMENKAKVTVTAAKPTPEQDPLDAAEPDSWGAYCARCKANAAKPTWTGYRAETGAQADDFDDDFDC